MSISNNNHNLLSNFSLSMSGISHGLQSIDWAGGKRIDSKEQILEVAGELALKFLTYDREGDSDLPEDVVLSAIESGLVTVDEIVESFRETLLDSLPDE